WPCMLASDRKTASRGRSAVPTIFLRTRRCRRRRRSCRVLIRVMPIDSLCESDYYDDPRGGYLPPALPALRRITSPWYLTPLPLYGSGGRSDRISAATWPTISLSEPSTVIAVGALAVSLIPGGALYWIGCENPSASCNPYGRVSAR